MEFEEIQLKAFDLWREWIRNRGPGQTIMNQDGLEYWIAKIAYEKGWQDRFLTSTTKEV